MSCITYKTVVYSMIGTSKIQKSKSKFKSKSILSKFKYQNPVLQIQKRIYLFLEILLL